MTSITLGVAACGGLGYAGVQLYRYFDGPKRRKIVEKNWKKFTEFKKTASGSSSAENGSLDSPELGNADLSMLTDVTGGRNCVQTTLPCASTSNSSLDDFGAVQLHNYEMMPGFNESKSGLFSVMDLTDDDADDEELIDLTAVPKKGNFHRFLYQLLVELSSLLV